MAREELCLVLGCRNTPEAGELCVSCRRLLTNGVLAIKSGDSEGRTFIHILFEQHQRMDNALKDVSGIARDWER